MSRQRKRFSVDDVVALFEELPRAQISDDYTEADRAADFIQTFTTEQGRRVLSQVTDYCSPHPSPADADKPGRLAFKEGQRWVLGEIMRSFVTRRRIPEIQENPNVD